MTVVIPDQIAIVPEMEVDQGAKAVTDQLRATATRTADVTSWTADNGAPADWSGDASEASSHAMTQFSAATDAVTAAFTAVAAACDTYVTTLATLAGQRIDLAEDQAAVNGDIQALLATVRAADKEDEPELQRQADALKIRVDRLHERQVAWEQRVTDNEDALIAAFAAADTVREGNQLSHAADRPDIDALNRQLDRVKGDPKAANAWWNSLTPAEREALKIDNPDVVGNIDGLPVDDRDEANRTALTRDLDRLKDLKASGELSPAQEQLLANAAAAQEALDQGDAITDPSTGLPVDSNLMLYQPASIHGDGAAAVAYGNPDTADNTSVMVPGIMNTAASVADNGTDALSLFKEAYRADPNASHATIAWIGYDSPDFDPSQLSPTDLIGNGVNAVDMGMVSNEVFAENGGHRLSQFVDGLRASDTGAESHLTVIGHSYGSTTVAHAAHDGLDADNLVLLGSPGAGGEAHDVGDLHMPEGSVYVGSRDRDFVTWLGRDGTLGLGPDPSQASFGATRIDVGNGEDFHAADIGGQGLQNHTSYFDPHSESLQNVADITVGHDPDTIAGRTQPANDYLKDYATREAIYYGNEGVHAVVDPVIDAGVSVGGQVVETTQDVIETGGEVIEGAGRVLEGAGRILTPPIPSFSGMWR
jgi:pimeloyl-ACP methyl ester carboxylesterase